MAAADRLDRPLLLHPAAGAGDQAGGELRDLDEEQLETAARRGTELRARSPTTAHA
jgi:hypothetical protein